MLLKALVELLKIKSIITLVTIGLFAKLAVEQVVSPEFTAGIIATVLTYYFQKRKEEA